jgi:hypothetical protein
MLIALEALEAREVLQLGQLHRGRTVVLPRAWSVAAVGVAGHGHLPLQLAQALAVRQHAAALLADLVTGQAIGEVVDLRLAALWRHNVRTRVCRSLGCCSSEGAGHAGDDEHGGELLGESHGAAMVDVSSWLTYRVRYGLADE